MPARMTAFALLILIVATTSSSAQPLTLGSTREEVMKIVYRDGAHADTLTTTSDVVMQVRMYPDTGVARRYAEVIRMAPVTMYGMVGYAALVFDSTGRLQSYRWMRADMKGFVLGDGWTNIYRPIWCERARAENQVQSGTLSDPCAGGREVLRSRTPSG